MFTILDNFFDKKTFALTEKMKNLPMYHGFQSVWSKDDHGHFSFPYWDVSTQNRADIAHRIKDPSLRQVWAYAKDKVEALLSNEMVLVRAYINSHVYGQDGLYHFDSETDGFWTLIVYLVEPGFELDRDAGGETLFIDDSGRVSGALPGSNRAVLFPSTMIHRASSPTRSNPGLRQTLVLKMRMKKDTEYEDLSEFLETVGATGAKQPYTGMALHDECMRMYEEACYHDLSEPVRLACGLTELFGTVIPGPPFNQSPMLLKEMAATFGYPTWILAVTYRYFSEHDLDGFLTGRYKHLQCNIDGDIKQLSDKSALELAEIACIKHVSSSYTKSSLGIPFELRGLRNLWDARKRVVPVNTPQQEEQGIRDVGKTGRDQAE